MEVRAGEPLDSSSDGPTSVAAILIERHCPVKMTRAILPPDPLGAWRNLPKSPGECLWCRAGVNLDRLIENLKGLVLTGRLITGGSLILTHG